jgi:hypothetical protein
MTTTQDPSLATASPTHMENSLHPDKGPSPYITANGALAHALKIEKPLQDALSALGINTEYVIQVGFNKAALQMGIVLEELYLTMPTDQVLSEAMAGVFAPFPGMVYTRK